MTSDTPLPLHRGPFILCLLCVLRTPLSRAASCFHHSDDKLDDADGDGIEDDEVVQVALELYKHHALILSIFDFYAAMASPSGTIDITRISSNAYKRFLKAAKMTVEGSKVATSGNLDEIFVLVNAKVFARSVPLTRTES